MPDDDDDDDGNMRLHHMAVTAIVRSSSSRIALSVDCWSEILTVFNTHARLFEYSEGR